jgi:hypothetical protein
VDVYRSSAVAAYNERPRGQLRPAFDPERSVPRWRWAAAAVVVVLITAGAGLLVRVPVGPVGTLLGLDGTRAVLALPSADAPRPGDLVRLRVDERLLTGRVNEVESGGGSALLVMVLVDLTGDVPTALPTGGPVMVDEGERPLLLDLVKGGDAR